MGCLSAPLLVHTVYSCSWISTFIRKGEAGFFINHLKGMGEGILKLFDHPTSTSNRIHWHLNPQAPPHLIPGRARKSASIKGPQGAPNVDLISIHGRPGSIHDLPPPNTPSSFQSEVMTSSGSWKGVAVGWVLEAVLRHSRIKISLLGNRLYEGIMWSLGR